MSDTMAEGSPNVRLRAGDWVEILSFPQIQATLDQCGCQDALPFMVEMVPFCGRRLRIRKVVQQVCIDGSKQLNGESALRAFRNQSVLILDEARCSGTAHSGCDKGCCIFWKTSWVKPVSGPSEEINPPSAPTPPENVQSLLPSQDNTGRFHCQSSELPKATIHISLFRRLVHSWKDIQVGNMTATGKLEQFMIWGCWKLHGILRGSYPRGNANPTPMESLNLQPGEWVEVKTLKEIELTLDQGGKNRGLHFSADMRLLCGRKLRVRRRLDGIVVEGIGQFRKFKNTVTLEGATCDSAYYAFGGCARETLHYWREIWLRRVQPTSQPFEAPQRGLRPTAAPKGT